MDKQMDDAVMVSFRIPRATLDRVKSAVKRSTFTRERSDWFRAAVNHALDACEGQTDLDRRLPSHPLRDGTESWSKAC